MPQISNSAILAAAGVLVKANAKAQKARESIATPPAVDSTGHPASPATTRAETVASHGAGGAG